MCVRQQPIRNPPIEIDAAEKYSHDKNIEIRERKPTKYLTRFDNLPTSSEQGERIIIEFNQLQVTNIGDTTPPYIAKESTKKRKPKTPKSDQKQILNQIWKQAAQQS